MKKNVAFLLLGAIILVVVATCFVANQAQRMRQFAANNVWANANPSVKNAYDNQGGWTGSSKGAKLMNLHTDMQTFDKSEGTLTSQAPPAGFRTNVGLLSQPFASAFQHTPEQVAPMPEGNEINPSPFAGVSEGNIPWKESMAESASGWTGAKVTKPTDMFGVYRDPFDYDKKSGEVTSAALEKSNAFEDSGRTKEAKEAGIAVNLGMEKEGTAPFESAFHQKMMY